MESTEVIIARPPRTRKRRLFTAKDKKPLKRITIKLDSSKWVSTKLQKDKLREELLREQNGNCPILGEPIKDPCLDHDHFEGRVRGVIGKKINLFEGQVTKLWGKHLADHTSISMSVALRNLADYLEKDNSCNKLHGGIIDDQKTALRRMTKETIVRRGSSDLGIEINEELDKSDMIRKYLEAFVTQLEGIDLYGTQ